MIFRKLQSALVVLGLSSLSGKGWGSEPNLVSAVVRDACEKELVFLGEASHGDGEAFQLKTRIVDRLLKECGFNAVFVESGVYDFARLSGMAKDKSGSRPFMEMSRAVGGLWSHFKETQSFIRNLHTNQESGNITVFGVDYQIGSGNYASSRMNQDLTSLLNFPFSRLCFNEFDDFFHWKYTPRSPFSITRKVALLSCLEFIEHTLEDENSLYGLYKVYLSNLHTLVMQFVLSIDEVELFNYRDSKMAGNLITTEGKMNRPLKAIVWTHNIHAAKFIDDLRPRHKSMANRIIQDYRKEVFSLAFSAYSGAYQAIGDKVPVKIGPAPSNSLETLIFNESEDLSVYCDHRCLENFGQLPTGIDYYRFQTHRPSVAFDGVIVIRSESPPTKISE